MSSFPHPLRFIATFQSTRVVSTTVWKGVKLHLSGQHLSLLGMSILLSRYQSLVSVGLLRFSVPLLLAFQVYWYSLVSANHARL